MKYYENVVKKAVKNNEKNEWNNSPSAIKMPIFDEDFLQ